MGAAAVENSDPSRGCLFSAGTGLQASAPSPSRASVAMCLAKNRRTSEAYAATLDAAAGRAIATGPFESGVARQRFSNVHLFPRLAPASHTCEASQGALHAPEHRESSLSCALLTQRSRREFAAEQWLNPLQDPGGVLGPRATTRGQRGVPAKFAAKLSVSV